MTELFKEIGRGEADLRLRPVCLFNLFDTGSVRQSEIHTLESLPTLYILINIENQGTVTDFPGSCVSWGLCYETFYGRNLWMFVIS